MTEVKIIKIIHVISEFSRCSVDCQDCLNLKSQNLICSEDEAYKMNPNIEEITLWLSVGQVWRVDLGGAEAREACLIWDCPRAQSASITWGRKMKSKG